MLGRCDSVWSIQVNKSIIIYKFINQVHFSESTKFPRSLRTLIVYLNNENCEITNDIASKSGYGL